MFRIVVTSPTFPNTPGPHHQQLQDAGCDVVTGPYRRAANEDELLGFIRDYDASIATTDAYTERVFAAAPRLKIISRFGVGYDQIDVAAATRHGVWVTTTPGANHVAVADHALTLILAIVRLVVPQANTTHAGKWQRIPGNELAGKTLGIIGFGRIGREVAQRAAGFGMRIVAYDAVQDADAAAALGASYVGLDDLLAQADVVTLHVALNPETRHLLNAERLALLKPSAYLVNTSRGEVIDEAALVTALERGQLAGAGLDVLAEEPPTGDQPLLRLPQVIVTPHVAGVTHESALRTSEMVTANILAVKDGRRPPQPVNDLP